MKIESEKRADLPEAVAHPEYAEPEFMERGRIGFRQTLREAADWKSIVRTPYGVLPLLVLTFIGVFQAFDTEAFRYLAPDILRDLDIEVTTIVNLLVFLNFWLIFVGLGVAYYADRYRRIPMVGISAIISGAFAFFTGMSRSLRGVGISRSGDLIVKQVTSVPDFSLVSDYYPPEVRGKVFATRATLGRSATVIAPLLIALIAFQTSWRVPFMIFGGATVVLGIACLFLKEPVRGYMERRAMGASEEVAKVADESPSLGEAWRIVWAVRTLRSIFISNIFLEAGSFLISLFFQFYLFDEYGLNLVERAILGAVAGATFMLGGFLGGGVIDTLTKRRPQRVLIFLGLIGVLGTGGFAVVVAAPPLWLLYATYCLYTFTNGPIYAASGVVFSQTLPAHVRSVGSAVQNLAAVPGLIISTALIALLFDRYGFQGVITAVVPLYLLGSIFELNAAGFFDRDMRSAFSASIASEEWRRARAEGRGKLLVCRDVDVSYDGVQVLFGVDFDVEEQEIIAILGTNGAGKSTLLRAISGTQEASGGAIVFDGRDITHMPSHEIAARGVTHVPGGRGVFPGLTVRENLQMGTWTMEPGEARRRLQETLEIFPVLWERQGERAGTLSGGEQQMLSLAQAFLGKPRFLMIDELSIGLSPAVIQQLIEIVRRIHAAGVTIIVVEQSVNIALTLAQRAIFMEKGEVKFFGNTSDLLRRPDILRAVYVKGTTALTEAAPTGALKTARELKAYELEHARPIIEVREVSKSYGGIRAVDDVSLVLREGESLGLIGPNGAGKTTLFDLISGYQIPERGQILFDGVDVTALRADGRANLRLVRRFQDARLFPSLTVYENLLVALDRKLEVRSTLFTALQFPQVRQAERRIRRRAERLIDLLELGAYRDKFVKELSTGLRRIVDLACVLAAEPKVLMLDEPSAGIAQAEAEGLGPLLRRVRFETGCSMLVIEHDIPLISGIADELVAMDVGQVIVRGSPDEVLNNERVIESYLGTSEEVVRRSGIIT